MRTATLHDLVALNDRLAAMAAADVPLPPQLGRADGPLVKWLPEVNAAISRRMAEGQSFGASLAAEEQVTPAYRLLLQLTANSDDRAAALLGSQRLARSVDHSSQILRRAFVYPLLVCGVAYLGFILSCLYLVPALEQLYANLQLPAGSALRWLSAMRMNLPYWIAIPPLLIGIVLFRVRRTHSSAGLFAGYSRQQTWWPGMQRVILEQQCSAFADTLANLLTAGMPFDAAWRLAAEAGNGAIFTRDARAPMEDSSLPDCPPFLRWALLHSEPQLSRASALRLAADVYYEAAERRIARLRVTTPVVVTALVGGSVTLLYALALFVPLAQLLRTIAS